MGLVAVAAVHAQAYTPKTLLKGQIDTSSVQSLAAGIIERAHAATPRQKAEAIWRFFLTDGRYVQPGFWYHLGGWAYEEPKGEVLDPLKLLNSYGFGLCYHIAAVLQAVYDAAGFADARVWFLTGHTVTEVFYDGAYHYFDSDMMGYTPVGAGKSPKVLPVASVQDIAADGKVVLGKVEDDRAVDAPWYPADVKAGAMQALVDLFTSTGDNWLFPFRRYAQGHSMEFVLRPGEKMSRYFGAEAGVFYLPYERGEKAWQEFPKDEPQYNIFVQNGPRSVHDTRDWGSGRLEYEPPLWLRSAYFAADKLQTPGKTGEPLSIAPGASRGTAIFDIRSPYVLIDAEFLMNITVAEGAELRLETSTDNGLTWEEAARQEGPFRGAWKTAPRVMERSQHGSLNVIAGHYAYLLRLQAIGEAPGAVAVNDIRITSRFQFNMRTLAPLRKGRNEFAYEPGPMRERWEIPVRLDQLGKSAFRSSGARYVVEAEQGMLLAAERQMGEAVFEVAAPDGSPLSSIEAGGRFLDLRDGLAPEKRTAEIRKTTFATEKSSADEVEASIDWAAAPDGPYRSLWTYDPKLQWKDGKPYPRVLRWPEVDRTVEDLPPGISKIYVRYRFRNMALDDVRLAAVAPRTKTSPIDVIHVWFEHGQERSHVERIANPAERRAYTVNVGGANDMKNYGVIFACPAPGR